MQNFVFYRLLWNSKQDQKFKSEKQKIKIYTQGRSLAQLEFTLPHLNMNVLKKKKKDKQKKWEDNGKPGPIV